MFAVIYHWQIKPGYEETFVEGWTRLTRAIHARCGSYGSRLHKATDGTWFGYARWPDLETRARCEPDEDEGRRLMVDAIDRLLEETTMEIVADLLDEPAQVGASKGTD